MDFYLYLAIVVATIFYMVYGKYKQISSTDLNQTRVQENKTLVSFSPPPSQNWEHHVFVSFRGADVREGFLSHLLKELSSKAIDPFIDNEMERGASINPELKRAIKGSKIAIVLLSKNYASSSWCLDELVKIIKYRKKIGQKVITIFYKVEPTDVKKQAGYFGKVFIETCKGKTCEVIQKWREALAEVATISGYDSRNWINEAAAIEDISIDISEMLNHLASSQYLDRLIGMETHMDEMQSLLRLDLVKEVRMIGIWGPPGIGKSTICRSLFNQFSSNFRHKAILVNIKQSYPNPCLDEGSAQLQLQSDMMSKMINHKDIVITHLGAAQDRLKYKKVLLVLDDVDQHAQLGALAGDSTWFGPGSRIIIATEDIRVLLAHGIGIDTIYKVNYPSNDEAFQMFCMYAFCQKLPFNGFTELAREVTYHAGNLPLGLQVMGSYFRGSPKNEWIEALPKLRSRLDGKIESILKFSYDALSDQCKDLLCQIVFYYHFDRVDNLEAYLAESSTDVRHGLRILAEKSFISFEDGYIIMHKLVVQLVQEIVRKQYGKHQYLVDAKNTCEDYTSMTTSVVGIPYTYAIDSQSTRLLTKKQSFIDPPYLLSDSENIIDISPEIRFSLMTCWLTVAKLGNLFGKLVKLWEGVKSLWHLKWMDLSNLELPNFSTSISFKEIRLECCSSLEKLAYSNGNSNIDESSSLVKLSSIRNEINRQLHLDGYTNLKALFSSLQTLYVNGCTNLRELPYAIGNATNLQILSLHGCTSLMELPSSIENMTNLRKLNLYGCSNLVKLPYSLGNVINLQNLNLTGCSSLVELPSSIGNLTNLEKLYLSHCSSLVKLPCSIGNLPKLKRLTLRGCLKLEVLPANINMEQLDIIDLTDHFVLQNFFELHRFRRNTSIV